MSIDAIVESSAASMSEDEMQALLTQEGVGTLALPTDDLPYVIPMSFGYDGESTLYFVFLLFGTDSRKEVLSDQSQRGRFLVYRAESVHEWQSVSLTGRITPVDDDGEWDALRDAMENAWHPSIFSAAAPMRGVQGYRFQIEEWTGIQQETSSE